MKISKLLFFLYLILFTEVFLTSTINSFQITEKKIFQYAVSDQVLFGININDAKLALGTLLKKYVEHESIEYEVKVKLYDDLDKLAEDYQKYKFDIVSVLATEYFYLKQKINIEPFLATVRSETSSSRFLLITNDNDQLNNIDTFQGKDIEFYSNQKLDYSVTYKLLEEFTQEKFEKPADEIFSRMVPFNNPHNSLLKVFFDEVDFCLIEDSQYELITELNPQLKSELKIVYSTDKIIPAIACKTEFTQDEKFFSDKATNMHKTIYGKQLMGIYKVNKVYSITEKDIESVKRLFTKSDK